MTDDMGDEVRGSAPILTTKDIILEIRADLRKVNDTVTTIASEQGLVAQRLTSVESLSSERRAQMVGVQAGINTRLSGHDTELEVLNTFRLKTEGAITLARWALGTSLLAAVVVLVQFLAPVLKVLMGQPS